MKITAVNADLWKMDGGVGFIFVTKVLWTRAYISIENSGLSPTDITDIDLYQIEEGIITGKDFKIHEIN